MSTNVNQNLHRFARLLALATFVLIVAGALVTSNRAGLAVPDWPTTYGYSMFTFPLSKMVGGIFYEHGHRLIASTVGLLTIILAVWILRVESRRWVRFLGIGALATVIAQGIFGGLTVRFFLPDTISIAHAALAEVFFCMTIALALVTSPRWFEPPTETHRARTLQIFALVTTLVVYAQLILGATVRHADRAVAAHILGAMVVWVCAGITIFSIVPSMRRKDFLWPAVALGLLVLAQFFVGIATLVVRVPKAAHGQLDPLQIYLPTLHLALGALTLAASFILAVQSFRFLTLPSAEKSKFLLRDYIELAKPRILSMVLVTTTIGFFLAGDGIRSIPLLLAALIGVGAVAGGAATLNNYLERDVDAKMERTRNRPLPRGAVAPSSALSFGVVLMLFGVILLVWLVNLLCGFLALLAAFLYVLVYTPMKRVSWLNTSIGAIPGAIPPLCGWAAASGELGVGAWVLFAILFAWQHPHFYAIAWIFRDDYRNAGFRMLSVIDPSGARAFRQIVWFSVLLLGVSLAPTAIGITGAVYFYGAALLGAAMLALAVLLRATKTAENARRLFLSSLIYLPMLWVLMIFDRGIM
jgi:protoheme IX farnesyltransferase